MRVLVTGGAGFIGTNFIYYSLKNGIDVINLDALTYAGNLANLVSAEGGKGYRFVRGSICDRGLVDRLLAEEKPDAVINFAAESHVDRSISGPKAFIDTNIIGVFTLLEAVRAHIHALPSEFRMIQVSTDEVYGSVEEGAFTENSPYRPSSPYSASKASGDHLVRAYHRTYGLPLLLTNCSNNYGPYQFPEKLIPLMILNCLSGKNLPVYGDGQQVRDWLYVTDHCSAILRVLTKGKLGETYNIGGDAPIPNLDVVNHICEILDDARPSVDGPHARLITHVKDRPGHDQKYIVDSGKIRAELGWNTTVDFAQGIERTVQWYLDNETWWRSLQGR